MSTTRMARYDRRMYALMNRTEGASMYATAARRRAVVGAHVALTTASLVAWVGVVAGEQAWALVLMLGLLLPWCVATGIINASTRGLLELRPRALDERQLTERHRVVARAHGLTTWVLIALAAATAAAADRLADVSAGDLLLPALVTAIVVHWIMPLWVAGFTAQDELRDDRDQEGPEG
jgi:hypothetical protein